YLIPTFASVQILMAVTSVLERLKERIGVDRPPVSATVEAGHLKRFAEAIGDPNPRWLAEAPPTFLVALAPASYHVPEAEAVGKGRLNGGNRFGYREPGRVGDEITATTRLADASEKSASRRTLLSTVFAPEHELQ